MKKGSSNFTEIAGQHLHKNNIPEKNNIFLLSDEEYFYIKYSNIISQKISVSAIGINNVIEFKDKLIEYKFNVSCKLSLVSQDLEIYTTIITITPIYIIYNLLPYNSMCTLAESDKKEMSFILSNERKPFDFFGKAGHDKILIRINEDNISSEWSRPISLTEAGSFTIQLHKELKVKESKQEFIYINIEKKIEDFTTYIALKETTKVNSSALVYNNCKKFVVKVAQENITPIFVEGNTQSFYSITNNIGNLIQFDIYEENDKKTSVLTKEIYISEKFQFPYTDTLKVKSELVQLEVRKEAFQIIFTFSDQDKSSIELSSKEKDIETIKLNKFTQVTEITCKLPYVGISIITQKKEKGDKWYNRIELIYIFLSGIIFIKKSVLSENVLKDDMQFKINDIQFDNSTTLITQYPVVIKQGIVLEQEDTRPPVFNFNFLKESNLEKNTSKITLFNYLIQTLAICIESDLIENMINFVTHIITQLDTSYTDINLIFTVINNTNIK